MKRSKGAKDMFDIPWHDICYYDETSPSCLRHSQDEGFGIKHARPISKGTPLGHLGAAGYFVYQNKKYGSFLIHRIIWILLNKQDIPHDCIIDHIDGDTTNNKISNLRVLPEAANNRNTKIYSNNTTGIVGVYFDTKAGHYYWKASWMELNGQQKTKAFSIKTYGLLPAMKMACEYRQQEIARLNREGAGYTQRHGK